MGNITSITSKEIRNIALLGHSGSGKTSLAESMLYIAKETDRLGKSSDGNTVCDFDPEEIKRHISISLSTAPLSWDGIKINLLDTPGYLDFVAETKAALRVADAAIILVDGKTGVEVGTELSWDYCNEAGLSRAFFINKCDDPEADYSRVFKQLHERFGVHVCPTIIAIKENGKIILTDLINLKAFTYDKSGVRQEIEMTDSILAATEEYKGMLAEAIAETDDVLMEKFFAGEEITREEAQEALHSGIITGSIVPVYAGAVTTLCGVTILLDAIQQSFPRPKAKKDYLIVDGQRTEAIFDAEGDPAIFVFKTVADPFVGKMSYFRVMRGTLSNTMTLHNARTGVTEKMAHIYMMRGKKQIEVTSLVAGEIGMLPKPAAAATNDTLYLNDPIAYEPIEFPESNLCKTIVPMAKGDEDKISGGVTKLLEEDLTLHYENDPETNQLLLYGIGDMHLEVIVSRLKSRYGISVKLSDPKIAYRETIKKTVAVEGKHKKQSGGSGQYGHVKITFSPGEAEGLTFTQSVVGGAVPKQYYPAVEKGLQEAMCKGVLAGFPVVNLTADLFDGSYHAVDSNEISFKLAAKLAYREGLPKADPVLLEPVVTLRITVPESLVGDVMGDLNKRRGRVLGMDRAEKKSGYTVVEAEAPKAEMMDYPIALRAMSQGRGDYTYRFLRYEEVPAFNAQKIIAEAKKDLSEE